MQIEDITDGALSLFWLALYIVVIMSIFQWVFYYRFSNVPGLSDLARIANGTETGV